MGLNKSRLLRHKTIECLQQGCICSGITLQLCQRCTSGF